MTVKHGCAGTCPMASFILMLRITRRRYTSCSRPGKREVVLHEPDPHQALRQPFAAETALIFRRLCRFCRPALLRTAAADRGGHVARARADAVVRVGNFHADAVELAVGAVRRGVAEDVLAVEL